MHDTDLNARTDYRGYKIITCRVLFTYYDFNYANTHCWICCFLQIYSSQAGHVFPFLDKIFIIGVLQNNRTFDILTFNHYI